MTLQDIAERIPLDLNLIQKIAIYALPVMFAITLHEAAHGYVARHFGDPTAYMLGRVTLNPLKHIDPIGTILVPLLSLLLGGILFGWAKPVPVNFGQLRNPKKDMLWVAIAGPGVNLVQIIFWAIIIRVAGWIPDNPFAVPMMLMGEAGMIINAVLMVLNMVPLPPLDGGRVAVSLLPMPWAGHLAKIEPYGFFILIALLFTGMLNTLIGPLINGALRQISSLFGV